MCMFVVFDSCIFVFLLFYFFFFKQKTAYEMRISDWSSDVCSSDLVFRCADIRNTTPYPPDLLLPQVTNMLRTWGSSGQSSAFSMYRRQASSTFSRTRCAW